MMLRAGVDLGGTKIQVVITDPLNRVLGSDRRFTPTTGGPDGVADMIADSIRAAANDGQVDLADIVGIGVGAPGQIDVAEGTVSNAGNLPDWMRTYALAAELSKRVGDVPVALGNDVQVGVNAEVRLGAGRPYNSLIGAFCGTGVGGGVVINRELWVGRGAAGEIGHVCIEAIDGAPCTCGRSGCMEAYAGRAAMEIQARKWKKQGRSTVLFKIMKKKGRTRLSSGVFYAALKQQDKMAIKLIDRAVWALGAALGDSVNLLDVEAVIIGGGLGIRLGQPFADRIHEAMIPFLIKPDRAPKVLLAELGDLGGALGAALLVEHLVSVPTQRESAPAAATKKPTVGKTTTTTTTTTTEVSATAVVPAKAPAKRAPAARKAPAKATAKAPAKAPAARKAAPAAKRAPAATKAAASKAPAVKAPVAKATATKSTTSTTRV